MFGNRVTYIIITVATFAAFLLTDSKIALFLCVCFVALPPISLVMLILAAKRIKFDYEIRESCIRGGTLEITMKAGLRPRFLAGFAQVVTEIENSTFHTKERKNFLFKDLSNTAHVYPYQSVNSGRISVKIRAVRLIDIFGVCSVALKFPKFAESIVSPVLYEDAAVHLSAGRSSYSGEISLPEKGGDHTEIYNVRDYVAGDSLNAIHWKLSGKFDTLKTKEFGSTYDNQTLILVDMSRKKGGEVATDDQLNAVLDVAISISDSLKVEGYAHSVGWFDQGAFYSTEVTDSNSFVEMVYKLMSIKVNSGNEEDMFFLARSPECLAYTKIIFVSASVTAEEVRSNTDFGITAISVGYSAGELEEDNLKIINMSCENVAGELTNRAL